LPRAVFPAMFLKPSRVNQQPREQRLWTIADCSINPQQETN
jgi:hypothetical protein